MYIYSHASRDLYIHIYKCVCVSEIEYVYIHTSIYVCIYTHMYQCVCDKSRLCIGVFVCAAVALLFTLPNIIFSLSIPRLKCCECSIYFIYCNRLLSVTNLMIYDSICPQEIKIRL